MKLNSYLRAAIILFVILSNIGCDQVSKNLARTDLADSRSISLIAHHFTLFRVENTGAFLSLGDSTSGPLRIILLVIIPLLMLGAALLLLIRKRLPIIPLVAISFIIGGGIGNIYDRLVHGSVTDFMHIDFGFFQTGIFNMADVSVMVGMFTLLTYNFLWRRKQRQLNTAAGE